MKYSPEIISSLKQGGIGVLPTDTIYGIVACALNAKAVERVYEVRRRRPDKPCIILIADVSDLSRFGITVDQSTHQLINKLWPGAISIILPCEHEDFSFLHRGTKTLAFRLPASDALRVFLRATGPLIAPSANPEGMQPATTIGEAKIYFDDRVDFYLPVQAPAQNGLKIPLIGAPSTVVEIRKGKVVVLRQGAADINEELKEYGE